MACRAALKPESTASHAGLSRTIMGGPLSPSQSAFLGSPVIERRFSGTPRVRLLGRIPNFAANRLDGGRMSAKLILVLNSGRTICLSTIPPGDLAMRFPTRATISWLLAGLLALVAGVGEGWHLIPGCGHAVEMPGGYVLVGVATPRSICCPDAGSPGVRRPQGDSVPCYDEDECPTCRLCSQGKLRAEVAGFCPALAVLHAVPATPPETSQARTRQPFDARAPPIG